MKFVRYNSIENVTNKQLYEFKESALYNPADIWVCTEKIHGSNFSITIDGDGNLTTAKRSSYIPLTASFFNFQRVLDKYGKACTSMIFDIFETGTSTGDGVQGVSIHGELCGGGYQDMPAMPNAKKIQKEIQYSNDTEFVVFDIRVYDSEGQYEYMPHNAVVDICKKYGVPVVPIIFQGRLDECLSWSAEHNADISEAWKLFGMPIELEGNIREGHVIKPLKSMFKGMSRIIFKDKNAKFKENKGSKTKSEHTKAEYSDQLLELLEDIDTLICTTRFTSVVSKYGDYSIRQFGELMNLMVEDIEDELNREDDLFAGLSNVDKAELHKILIKKVSAFFVESKKELF